MPAPHVDLRAICKTVVVRCIEAERDCPEEMRARVDIAYRDGWLTEEERAVFDTLGKLEADVCA